MKKKPYNELSTKVCTNKNCDRRLKQRIVDLKPTATLCYRCFKDQESQRGHFINNKKATKKQKDRFSSRDKKNMKDNVEVY